MKYVPKTTDVVFVVEAQYCNKNIRKRKNIDLLIETVDSKLQGSGLADNRYYRSYLLNGTQDFFFLKRRLCTQGSSNFKSAILNPERYEGLQIEILMTARDSSGSKTKIA